MGQIAAAQQATADLSMYLPADNDVPGLQLDDSPNTYSGEELFQMINGGASIYHEYGFRQVLDATYTDGHRQTIRLEIFQMASPASAYGMYTFKTSGQGQELSIGQEALLRDYYLNFWKGDMLVTVIGMDAEEETVKDVVALAKAVSERIACTGEQPKLAELLRSEPHGFSQSTYVRGPLGLKDHYIFDTKNIFQVQEGMIGTVDACQVFVFRYKDDDECTETFEHVTEMLAASKRFRDGVRQANQYSMFGRNQEFILINQIGPYIAIVISQNRDQVMSTRKKLVKKLN